MSSLDEWKINFQVIVDQESFKAFSEKLEIVKQLVGNDESRFISVLKQYGVLDEDCEFCQGTVISFFDQDNIYIKCDLDRIEALIDFAMG